MDEDGVLGLREQKRLATRRALQVALLELSLERGFDNVTIEEVGRAAQVSPRTFFNYFTSKEDAVTGRVKPFQPTGEAVSRFVNGTGRIVPDLIEFVAESTSAVDEPIVHRLRRRLLEQDPGLLGSQVASAHRFEERLGALITERLRTESGDAPPAGRVRMLGFLAVVVLRSGWAVWVAEEGVRPLGDCVREAYLDFVAECGDLPPLPVPLSAVGSV